MLSYHRPILFLRINFVTTLCVQLTELKDELHPLVQMVSDGKIPPGKVSVILFVAVHFKAAIVCIFYYRNLKTAFTV